MKLFNLEIKRYNQEERHGVGPEHQVVAQNNPPLGLSFAELVGQYTAMNLSTVFRAVDLISDAMAVLPLEIKVKKGDSYTYLNSHQLYEVLNDKNAILSKYNLVKLLIQSVLLKGNGFAYIQRDATGGVKGIKFLESGEVSINYDKQKGNLYYLAPSVSGKKIEPINMIHLRKHTYDGVNGISVISYANRSIKTASAAESSASNFYSSGCNLSGILKVEGQLNPQQRKDILNNWGSLYTSGNQGLCVIPGNMSYQALQLSAADSQLLESRQFSVSEIARWFGISPVLLGDLTKMSYNSVEALQTEFLVNTLTPYIIMLEQEFTRKLLKYSESNMVIELDESYLLRTNKQSAAQYYSTLVNTGILSRNEVRESLGYEKVEGLDDMVIPFTKVEDNTVNKTNNENEEGNTK